VVDSHCHLAGKEFAADLEGVVARARAAGLAHALVILAADDDEEIEQAQRVSAIWDAVRFSIGVHPHAAGKFSDTPAASAGLTENRIDMEPAARAVGEIGLDYHYNFAPRDVQQQVFREQIRLARRRQLPIVIHMREAADDTFQILSEEPSGEGVFHCFTGDRAMARDALDLGFYLSFAGIVTFPKASDIRDAAAIVPDDRLLVETDSPFLAPVPHRGKRNEPAYVGRVIETLASIRGVSAGEIDAITTENFLRFVGDRSAA
jgi:TatD DNase family protein